MLQKQRKIIFFDGVCNLCNTTVDFIITRDHQRRFLYAPLQGKVASDYRIQMVDSIVYWDGEKSYLRSDAVIKILKELSFPWSFLGRVLFLIPKIIRDGGYQIIAKNRYSLFGKRQSCRLPQDHERNLFLD